MSSFGAFVSWGKRVRREGFTSLGNQGQDFQAEEAALVTWGQRQVQATEESNMAETEAGAGVSGNRLKRRTCDRL